MTGRESFSRMNPSWKLGHGENSLLGALLTPSTCQNTETTKFSSSPMVWGAISGDGYRTLVKCQVAGISEQYQRLLHQEWLDLCSHPSMLFQQDGATIHTSMTLQSNGLTDRC